MLEETGIAIECGPLIDVVDAVFRNDEGRVEYHYTLIDFAGTADDNAAPIAGDDIDEARFVPLDALDEYGLWDETKRIILKAVEAVGESSASD